MPRCACLKPKHNGALINLEILLIIITICFVDVDAVLIENESERTRTKRARIDLRSAIFDVPSFHSVCADY